MKLHPLSQASKVGGLNEDPIVLLTGASRPTPVSHSPLDGLRPCTV